MASIAWSAKNRKRVDALRRRRDYLTARERNDFDRAERAAVEWALDVIDAYGDLREVAEELAQELEAHHDHGAVVDYSAFKDLSSRLDSLDHRHRPDLPLTTNL